jgi:acyl transferase domain-containing protein/NAD(P)H-dependent flavin oxidoreductase YrpB (nitropropane dioxygenase family)
MDWNAEEGGTRFVVYSPAAMAHCGLALAAARAGALGCLDFEHVQAEELEQARTNRVRLQRLLAGDHLAGLRVDAAHAAEADFAPADWTIVLALASPEEQIATARRLTGRRLFVEIAGVEDLVRLQAAGVTPDTVIACGSESGGWTSPTGSFVLAQKFARAGVQVILRGASGPLAVAACRLAGCEGVVLSSELLLMSDSPLAEPARRIVARLDSGSTTLVGERLGAPLRIVHDGAFARTREIQELALRLEAQHPAGDDVRPVWRDAVRERVGWGDPARVSWPVGQGIGAAARFASRYGTVGSLLREWQREISATIGSAAANPPFAANAPLAQSQRTEYPVVQGPMTRVSDNAAFAQAVAGGGGLPMIALALLQGDALTSLLDETGRLLAGRSWGAGILGFVPPEIRAEQIDALLRARPPLALIAGGRPDQARQLDEAGIATYLHVPSAALVGSFLESGARRFVFEGSESGGHVGPLGSFALWESAVNALLEALPPGDAGNVHVLFAGGIHDALSAAMASLFAVPLARRGVRTGILMGTAYLFTAEAVASGAIVPQYQRQAIACRTTVTLESGTGHANRCAATPFATEFNERRRALLSSARPAAEMKDDLDRLGLGRLRLATKGKIREGAAIIDVDETAQLRDGMYMLGEAATLRDGVTTIAELHHAVCIASAGLLAGRSVQPAVKAAAAKPCDIAIIGIATRLPGATDLESFWDNMLHARSAIREIPEERWDWRMLYDTDRQSADRSYSRWGGFFDDVVFDPVRFGIPPNSVRSIGVAQLLALEIVDRALADAGYDRRPFDRERVAVLMAEADHGGMLSHHHIVRTVMPFVLSETPKPMVDRLAEWNEDSFPGSLSNITAGRVANRFDFGGPNFAIDAACASSLTALDLAAQELEAGRSDMAVVGGIDTGQHPYGYIAFSRTQALSPTGQSRPFDKRADGIVISEGIVVVVLKRLVDAERDGDSIYAVVKSVAGSSDGRAMGMTAPRPAGQLRALRRAYARAGVAPSEIGYYEAHGTGTAVGDKAEAESIATLLRGDGTSAKQCAVGSAKALIGHTKTAAGLVAVVKTALALQHGVIPPHRIEEPLDEIADSASPLYASPVARPWLSDPTAAPRRAGVSAFGFGGTNSHAVLEEYRGRAADAAPGAERWPCELLVFRAATKNELLARVRSLGNELSAGAQPNLRDLAFSCATGAATGDWTASLVATSLDDAGEKLRALEAAIEHGSTPPSGIALRRGEPVAGAVAVLFPGQGSQYAGMARQASLFLGEVRSKIEAADARLREPLGVRLGALLDPLDGDDRHLIDTAFAQPAIGATSVALASLLDRVGVRAAMYAGHSYGEYAALHAAGALTSDDLLRLSMIRGQVMRGEGRDMGTMIAVAADAERIAPLLDGIAGVVIANRNTLSQTVLSGTRDGIAAVASQLDRERIAHVPLPVSGAFHSPLMEAAQGPLAEAIAVTPFTAPHTPVYGCADGEPYPNDAAAVRERLSRHLLHRVDFVAVIERMYADGARFFVEAGPSSVLTQMVGQILGDRPHTAVSLDRRGGGLVDQLAAIGTLWAAGHVPRVDALFASRNCRLLDLTRLAAVTAPAPIADHAFLINGMWARQKGETRPAFGRDPLRDSDSPLEILAEGATRMVDHSEEEPASSPMRAYEAYQQTMRQFLKTQEEVLRMFLGSAGGAEAVLPATTVTAPAVASPQLPARPQPQPQPQSQPRPQVAKAPAQPPPAKEPQPARVADVSREGAAAALKESIAEVTGYPQSMIDVEGDLEGDLGVDSIRRLQVFQKFRRRLPPQLAEAAESGAEQIARARSVRAILDALFAGVPQQAPAIAASNPLLRVRDGEPPIAPECPRFVMRAFPRPLPSTANRLDGTFLVTGETSPILPHVLTHLRARGARPIVLTDADCGSRDSLAVRLERLAAEERISGVVHLVPAVATLLPNEYERWRERTQLDTKAFFHILNFTASRGIAMRWLAAVSAFGGAFGRDGAAPAVTPSAGAAVGLLKTYAIEHSGAVVKTIDVDLSRPAAEIGAQLVDELAAGDRESEIGLAGGRRSIFAAVAAPPPPPAVEEESRENWVVLVTGGARGITARVTRALAARGQTMIIVGRARLAGQEDPSLHGIETVDMLRRHLIDKAMASGANVKPAQIDAELSELLRDREIRYNIDAFTAAGADVRYEALDVRSPESFEKLIADTYERYGRIDAVVHGAGVIADKLLAEKSHDAFEHVFDTKVDSTYLLFRNLRPETLRVVLLFASTAGRFGNRGQSDYAAANEVVNRFAWRMKHEWPSVNVKSINWGPWLGSGMASQPINDMFRARGVEPIDPRAGIDFALREIATGGEVEVVAGAGPWREAEAKSRESGEAGTFASA